MAKDVMPALYGHCVTAYRVMLSEGKSQEDDDGQEIIVWEGMTTALVAKKLNLSTPYFTNIFRNLQRMGCVRQIKRGGGSAPSMWELITEPTEELYKTRVPMRKKGKDRLSMQQEQISRLGQRLLVVERALENLIREEENNARTNS